MTPENVASDFTTFLIAESILLVLVLIVLPIIAICRTRNRATVKRTCISPWSATIIGFYFGSGGSGHIVQIPLVRHQIVNYSYSPA